ncbi:hypothetical protein CAEBREN_01699 [Caenorhabditis brenneri]|uniref:Sdz-33 F-box domain-containing protein n=1 Tax=Caenorhabditis brenneri TaxID=135651 RepID=G0N0E4_CAEBE|nr:hypothetical protein CAEBREN_01699 [Caenorhabditis brenneri]
MQYWLKHLQEIFNCRKIDFAQFFIGSSQFDIDDIKKVFGNTNEVKIGNTGCYVFNQMIFEKFFPIEKLQIHTSDFPDSRIPKKILMQNFADLHIGEGLEATSMTLDELLIINSKVIQIKDLQMPAKQFNKFIKLWQNGSNPHLEYLTITYPYLNHWQIRRAAVEEDDFKAITKGIEHCVISRDTYRNFKVAGLSHLDRMNGGIDIFRKDGVKATIELNYYHFPVWKMLVWFDHCVVET